jgi:hypothetical protein
VKAVKKTNEMVMQKKTQTYCGAEIFLLFMEIKLALVHKSADLVLSLLMAHVLTRIN